jgi:DNA-binding response OmpR family regulator
MPQVLHAERMIVRLYGDQPEPEFARQSLTVHIYRLRRKLSPLKIDIQCIMTRGYRVIAHG